MSDNHEKSTIRGIPDDFSDILFDLNQDPKTLIREQPILDNKPEPVTTKTEPRKILKVTDKGIHLGEWHINDSGMRRAFNGKTNKRVFDIYAAPTDIANQLGDHLMLSFNDAVNYVAHLRNWHGHDGIYFDDHRKIIKAAIKTPDMLRSWFIPPMELLGGGDEIHNVYMLNNLYNNKELLPDDSAVKGVPVKSCEHLYWSTSRFIGNKRVIHLVSMNNGSNNLQHSDQHAGFSIRPFRAELKLSG